jgi:hypothetical protein
MLGDRQVNQSPPTILQRLLKGRRSVCLLGLKQNRRVKKSIIITAHSFHVKVTRHERDNPPSDASVL